MTQDQQAIATAAKSAAPPARRLGVRVLIAALRIVTALVVVLVVGLTALWLRLAAGPVTVPAAVTQRVEARLDAAMTANSFGIGRIEISRPAGGGALDLALRGLRLTDPDGMIRAAFPAVVVGLATPALLQGRVEPLTVDLQGAGLRFARDIDGRIDFALIAGDTAAEVSLGETLARLDRMFATPVLSRLQSVRGRGLELVMADAMTGQTLRISDADMRLDRSDGQLSLHVGGALSGSRAGTIDITLTRGRGSGITAVSFGFNGLAARDVATFGPALAWVDLLRAPISGHLAGDLADDGSLGDMALQLDIGAGELRPTPDGAAVAFDRLQAALRYARGSGRIAFERFDLEAPGLALSASGHADLDADGTRYVGQFQISNIAISRPALWPDPLTLDAAMIDFRLGLSPHVTLDIGQAAIRDKGLALAARGQIALLPDGLDLALDLTIPRVSAPDAFRYWPAEAAVQTRRWLAANLAGGQLSGVDLSVRVRPGEQPDYALGFDFSQASLRVLPELPPVEAAAGYVDLRGPMLRLRLDQGQMVAPDAAGDGRGVELGGSTLVLDDVRVQGPVARIDLAIAGGMVDVLRLMQPPPIRLFATGTMTPERIGDGHAALRAAITTRFQRQEGLGDTVFDVTGTISGYRADQLVPGHRLEAERLDVHVTPDAVRVSGQARFDGLALSGQWHRALGPQAARVARLDAEAMIGAADLRALGINLADGLLTGQMPVSLVLEMPDGAAPDLRLGSDLAGAGLALPPLGWRQRSDQRGRFEAQIRLGASPAVTRFDLAVDGLDIAGRAALDPEVGLDRLTADRFRIDDWLDVTGAWTPRGAGPAAGIEITGGVLDLRGAPQTARASGGDGIGGVPVVATLDRLQVTEGIAIQPFLANLTTQGGLSGQFRGRVNGAAQVSGTLIDTQAGPAIRLRAADGGDVLRSAGVFRSAYGGEMELILQSAGAPGVYDGLLRIDAPRLRDAPVLAEMLNIVSVVGVIDQLTGDGINMGEVEARFRITPTGLTLTEGVALGPSLGLSLQGSYDLASRQLAMDGVLSPLNAVNSVFGAIFSPRREGLFGFAYTLTGPAQAPQVNVQPLSILTPGVFREIFRRPPPN